MSAFDIGCIIWASCMAIIFGVFIVGLFIMSDDYYSFTPRGRDLYNIIEFVSLIALLDGMSFGASILDHKHKLTERAALQTAINNDYTFYLNGIEVEPDTVYLNDYTVHIDDEEQTVLMSCK